MRGSTRSTKDFPGAAIAAGIAITMIVSLVSLGGAPAVRAAEGCGR